MSFGATLTVSVNAVNKVLNRINQDNYGSEYFLRTATDSYRAKIRHAKESPAADGTKLDRHNVELVHTIFGTSGAKDTVRTAYIVLRVPENDDLTTLGYFVAGFVDYLDSSTVQSDVLTWQS